MQLKSISIKIILIFVGTIILIMGSGGVLEYFLKVSELNQSMNVKLKALPNNIAMVVSSYLWNYDKENIRNLLINYMDDDREISSIKLLDVSGQILFGFKRDVQERIIEEELTKEEITKNTLGSSKADIMYSTNVIGEVEIFLNKTFLQAAIIQVIISTIVRIVLLSLVSIIILVFLLEKVLIGHIKVLTSKFKEISEGEGDLTFQLEAKTNDELGSLAVYFNQFIKNLNSLIKNTKNIVTENKQLGGDLFIDTEQVSASITEISAIMNAMNQKIENLNQELFKTKNAVTQVGSFVTKAITVIDEQSSSVTQSSSAVEEMMANINNLVIVTEAKKNLTVELTKAAEEGDINLKNTVDSINEITKSAEFMFEIIGVINNISRQTNLLAMNAAIEAAHAGDYGRGFSVVAEEIRNLAETSSKNTKSMSQSLKVVIEKIKNTAIVSNKANAVISQLISGIKQIAEAMNEMLVGLKEVNIGSEQMTVSLTHLINLTEEVKSSSLDLNTNFSAINNSIKGVFELADDNKKSISETVLSVNEISQSIHSLRELSTKNSDNLTVLDKSLAKFKTE